MISDLSPQYTSIYDCVCQQESSVVDVYYLGCEIFSVKLFNCATVSLAPSPLPLLACLCPPLRALCAVRLSRSLARWAGWRALHPDATPPASPRSFPLSRLAFRLMRFGRSGKISVPGTALLHTVTLPVELELADLSRSLVF